MSTSTINRTKPEFTSQEVAVQLENLQYAGQLEIGEAPRVAVIGSQACTRYGEHVAAELAGELAARGMCVAGTFSHGADCAALQGGLAAGGRVLGIAPQSLDVSYPKRNAALQDRVMTEGLAVTAYPQALSPTKQQFLMTRLVLAHLVDAVVIVEAPQECRSLITVAEALRIGRPVYAVPGPITSYQSEGTHQLLKDRKVKLLTSADDLRLPLLRSGFAR